MSDELDVRIKTTIEADEAKSAQRIESQLPSIANKVKGKIKVDIEANTDSVKHIQDSVKAATNSAKGGTVVVPVKVKADVSSIKDIRRTIPTSLKTLPMVGTIKVRADTDYLRRSLVQDFRRFQAQANGIKLNFNPFEKAFNSKDIETAGKELNILFKRLRASSAEGKSTLPDLAITNFKKNVQDAVAATDTLYTSFRKLSGGIPNDVQGKLLSLREELEKLGSVTAGDPTGKEVIQLKELSASMEDLYRTLKKLRATDTNAKIDIGAEKLQTDVQRAQQTLQNMRKDWSKAFTKPQFLQQWQNLFDTISSGSIKSRAELNAFNAEVSLMGKQIEGAGMNMKTLWGRSIDNAKKFFNWLGVGSVIVSSIRGLNNMVDSVKAVDVQMTELRKVTDETEATYDRFFSNASKRAVELATSLDKYIGSVADFSRMGFNLPDSQKLADAATIYFNVGDGLRSMDEATNSVISTLKAYQLSADQASKVTDIFNEVSNRFAVTSGGIGAGMQRAGAALAVANTSLEKSVALWTAMNEIIQDDESSATSLRFIAQRMRNTAGELEKMGEDSEGAAESVTKLQQQLLKLTGVDIMSDSENFRDVYDVLKDISSVWDDITDKDRADVIRLMAGTRQSTAFSALMQNFSSAEKALDVALQSSGSAYRENEKWLNSIEAKQQRAQASFEAFSNAILSSDLIKSFYDSGTGILGFLTTLTEKLGALPLLASAAAAAMSFKNVGKLLPYPARLGTVA